MGNLLTVWRNRTGWLLISTVALAVAVIGQLTGKITDTWTLIVWLAVALTPYPTFRWFRSLASKRQNVAPEPPKE